MQEAYREYFDFMERLGGTLDQLTKLAERKAEAVRRGDLSAVDSCMKQEQALSLSLRTMDRKREKLLADMGLKDTNLSGLVQNCPTELKADAKAAADRLRGRYELYRGAADAARTLLEVNLHKLDKMLADEVDTPMHGSSVTDFRA